MSLVPIQYETPSELAPRRQPGALTFEPRNLPELIEWARTICNSDIVGKDMKGKPENIIIAVQLGNELGLSCARSLQSIYVVNGRPSIYGDAMLGIVKASGLLAEFSETVELDDAGKVIAAICYARRVGDPEHEPYVFTWQDALDAGLPGRNPLYNQYRKRMLTFKARGYELRTWFADLVTGIRMVEEMMDIEDHEPGQSAADRIAEARERMRKPAVPVQQSNAPAQADTAKQERADAAKRLKNICKEAGIPCGSQAEAFVVVKDRVRTEAKDFNSLDRGEIEIAIQRIAEMLQPVTEPQKSDPFAERTPEEEAAFEAANKDAVAEEQASLL